MIKICDLDASKFDALFKIITILENFDSISIKSGIINQVSNTNYVTANLRSIFGEDFNIDIVNPKKCSKLFKNIVRKNISLFDDLEMNRFIISNNEIKLFFPKKTTTATPLKIEANKFCEPIKIKDNKKIIKNLIGTNEVKLLIHENQLKGILVDETGIYQFPEYEHDNFLEKDCKILVSYGFLGIDSNEYELHLGKDSKGQMWLHTSINFDSNIKFSTLENVNEQTLNNILI